MNGCRPIVLILGASGHGRVVADVLEKDGRYEVAGFIDNRTPAGSEVLGYPVLGDEEALPGLCRDRNVHGLFVAVGDNWQRGQLAGRLVSLSPGISFVSAVHPAAQIAKGVHLGQGVAVMAGAVLNSSCEVGDFCIVNTKASLDHDARMREFSSLAPGVTVGGNVEIGAYSAIGLGASVREKTRIGEHTVVGAGAVVLDDLPGHVVAYGTPARVVRARAEDEPYLRR